MHAVSRCIPGRIEHRFCSCFLLILMLFGLKNVRSSIACISSTLRTVTWPRSGLSFLVLKNASCSRQGRV
jgi:hypothetical protein